MTNNVQSFKVDAGTAMIEQRNAGFVDNDGRWILWLLPVTAWLYGGSLYRTVEGGFKGVFDTEAEARDAAAKLVKPEPLAKPVPITSLGWAS